MAIDAGDQPTPSEMRSTGRDRTPRICLGDFIWLSAALVESFGEERVFVLSAIGGRDYLPLFNALTTNLRRERIAFFRADGATSASAKVDHNSSIRFRPYPVAARTNWHYQCALDLAKGMIPTGARNRRRAKPYVRCSIMRCGCCRDAACPNRLSDLPMANM